MKKVILLFTLTLCVVLSGCQSTPDAASIIGSTTKPETGSDADVWRPTAESPFNTLINTEEWGDESDFLRIVDVTDELEFVHASEFEGHLAALEDERAYGFVMLVHNTSDMDQTQLSLTLSYPRLIAANIDNEVEATLSWGGQNAGAISDTLILQPSTAIHLSPIGENAENIASVVDATNPQNAQISPVMTMDDGDMTTHVLPLDALAAGEARTVFIMVETLPVFQG